MSCLRGGISRELDAPEAAGNGMDAIPQDVAVLSPCLSQSVLWVAGRPTLRPSAGLRLGQPGWARPGWSEKASLARD